MPWPWSPASRKPRPVQPASFHLPPNVLLFFPCRIRHDRKRGAPTLPVFTSSPLAQALPAPTPASFCILQWSPARSSALRAPSCLICRVDKHLLVVNCVQCSTSRKPSQVGLSSSATRAAGAVAMAPRKPLRHQCLARDLPCTESGPDAPSPTSSCESSLDPAGPIGAPFVPDELNPCIATNHCRLRLIFS